MKVINLFVIVACIVAAAMADPGNANAQGVTNSGYFFQGRCKSSLGLFNRCGRVFGQNLSKTQNIVLYLLLCIAA
ncbi:hypothetical protein CVS40_12300 [Lucilia cuprina]|nr:hypothetical protein CVS40_12300 [Lucilia cuprina]